jgi:hypothetical protein
VEVALVVNLAQDQQEQIQQAEAVAAVVAERQHLLEHIPMLVAAAALALL